MTEQTRYVEVSWELPLRTVRGTPIAPADIAAVRIRFWREPTVTGSTVDEMDVPPTMLSVRINLPPGRWLFTAQAILDGDVYGRQSLPKLVTVGAPVDLDAPRPPRGVAVTLLPPAAP